jgi:hypothetical protein
MYKIAFIDSLEEEILRQQLSGDATAAIFQMLFAASRWPFGPYAFAIDERTVYVMRNPKTGDTAPVYLSYAVLDRPNGESEDVEGLICPLAGGDAQGIFDEFGVGVPVSSSQRGPVAVEDADPDPPEKLLFAVRQMLRRRRDEH